MSAFFLSALPSGTAGVHAVSKFAIGEKSCYNTHTIISEPVLVLVVQAIFLPVVTTLAIIS